MKRVWAWIATPFRLTVLCARLAAFALGLTWRRRRARAVFRRRLGALGIDSGAREVLGRSYDPLPRLSDLLRKARPGLGRWPGRGSHETADGWDKDRGTGSHREGERHRIQHAGGRQ